MADSHMCPGCRQMSSTPHEQPGLKSNTGLFWCERCKKAFATAAFFAPAAAETVLAAGSKPIASEPTALGEQPPQVVFEARCTNCRSAYVSNLGEHYECENCGETFSLEL